MLVRLSRPLAGARKQAMVAPTLAIAASTTNPSLSSQNKLSSVRWLSEQSHPASNDVTTSSKTTPELDVTKFTVRIELKMPDMGEGGGKILKWYKEPGDIVKREDVLCDIETPDFTFGMETDDEQLALMGEILVEAPSGTIQDNEVICVLLHEEKKPKET